jgi:hypothetical protein
MREKLPPEELRVKIHGRVDPETHRRLEQFDGRNLARKLDAALLYADALREAIAKVSKSNGAKPISSAIPDEDAAVLNEEPQP